MFPTEDAPSLGPSINKGLLCLYVIPALPVLWIFPHKYRCSRVGST